MRTLGENVYKRFPSSPSPLCYWSSALVNTAEISIVLSPRKLVFVKQQFEMSRIDFSLCSTSRQGLLNNSLNTDMLQYMNQSRRNPRMLYRFYGTKIVAKYRVLLDHIGVSAVLRSISVFADFLLLLLRNLNVVLVTASSPLTTTAVT